LLLLRVGTVVCRLLVRPSAGRKVGINRINVSGSVAATNNLFRLLCPMRQVITFINARSPWVWLGIGLAAVFVRGLFIDVMDVDASQYASISMEMLQNGSWLQVQHRGADYLDKPPLLFWLSTASFALFGVSNWAYKLPSLLAALAGVWGLYRFTLLYYSPKTARQAAFILASSLGLIIICNDVRTDTLLLGATTCAIWQLAEYLQHPRWRYLFGAFIFIGLAMLAKGPIGLVVPGFAVGAHLLLSRQWRAIFKWQWLVGLVVTALVLAPMCWGLWQQFDLHPEKLVNGRTGVSGLYFFFWEQSFGRVTGENVWRNDASAFYFLHVYLWAFLPWCLLLPGGLYNRLLGKWSIRPQHQVAVDTQIAKSPMEIYTIGAFVLTFLALSTSQYKLPHYIFVTLPWAAVLVASHLNTADNSSAVKRWQWIALYVAVASGLAIAFLLPIYVFPTGNIAVWGILLSATIGLVFKIIKNPFPADTDLLVQRGVWAAIIIGFVLNFHFYPNLLPYQSAKSLARFAKENDIPASKIAFFHRGSHALDFYNGDILEDFEAHAAVREHAKKSGTFWLHVDEAGKGELELAGVRFEVLKTFHSFQVALLKPAFLDPSRRDKVLDAIYLLKIPAEQE
jgi:4-amino-4-deoxy-L-arabinose transferase-like glycosyltransferase